MVKTTVTYWEVERIARLQELVKLLELKTFKFLWTGQIWNGKISATWECEVEEQNRLNKFFEPWNNTKPWSKWKKFWYKFKNLRKVK